MNLNAAPTSVRFEHSREAEVACIANRFSTALETNGWLECVSQ
jgi:hypothetical protein